MTTAMGRNIYNWYKNSCFKIGSCNSASFKSACFKSASFKIKRFPKVQVLNGASFKSAIFQKCMFQKCKFQKLKFFKVFKSANLKSASFQIQISKVQVFKGGSLTYAHFSRVWIHLYRIKWYSTVYGQIVTVLVDPYLTGIRLACWLDWLPYLFD